MDAMTGKLALKILGNLKAREREYREEREEWYRAGDGRSPRYYQGPDDDRPYNYGGKGYSFPAACVHGSSAWTDYDNICGPCEDGYSIYQLAIWEAKERVSKVNERINWLCDAPDALRNTDMHRDLIEWALSPIR
ncbi:hypothetical protein SEA_TUNATARTARE_256 [Streptomyces phage TunaTartare]|uniref:Uncharacterized protein n=1 Tax=Streptomyces phage TunaTartare TaxID=2848887 RepID=A0A8F2E773_9CAUD|nr:hypothetical protein PP457_gp024 [Streptomyces phage TunaTartare]QWT30118.1 hypothetical protein SEA_TUNATARTARE_256 [Streptomyces phage TunaTartare]